jgi:hypothetical protein
MNLRGKRNHPRATNCEREPRQHREVSMKPNLLQPANTKGREPAMRFQVCELTLNGSTAPVQIAEPLTVPKDAREEATANADGKDWLLPTDAAQRDNRVATPLLALGVNAGVVITLVHCAGLRFKAASAESVKERGYEVRFLPPSRLYLPRKRQTRLRTDREMEFVAVEASAFASRDSGAMPPRGIGVAEPLALAPALGNEPLAIGVGGQITCVNGYVFSQVGVLLAKRRRASVETRRKRGSVVTELASEAVHRPHTRRLPERCLEARMLHQWCPQRQQVFANSEITSRKDCGNANLWIKTGTLRSAEIDRLCSPIVVTENALPAKVAPRPLTGPLVAAKTAGRSLRSTGSVNTFSGAVGAHELHAPGQDCYEDDESDKGFSPRRHRFEGYAVPRAADL